MPQDNHHDEDVFSGRTFLYIRDNILDDGSEPSPNALPQWLSPDIIVTPPGGAPNDDPIEGVANDVAVTVTNRGGIDAMNVWVDAFVGDVTTGFTPSTAVPVGSGYLNVPAKSSATINFSWIPIVSGPTHRCMLARASLIIPPDTYINASIFDTVNDRHIAQRNLNLIQLSEERKMLSFAFMIVNPLGEEGLFYLQADEIEPTRKNLELLRQGVGCKFAQFGETPLPAFGLHIGEAFDPQIADGRPTFGVVRERRGLQGATIASARRAAVELMLKPDEVRRGVVTVERNPETRSGDLHILEISQVDVRTKQTVGGFWLVLQH